MTNSYDRIASMCLVDELFYSGCLCHLQIDIEACSGKPNIPGTKCKQEELMSSQVREGKCPKCDLKYLTTVLPERVGPVEPKSFYGWLSKGMSEKCKKSEERPYNPRDPDLDNEFRTSPNNSKQLFQAVYGNCSLSSPCPKGYKEFNNKSTSRYLRNFDQCSIHTNYTISTTWEEIMEEGQEAGSSNWTNGAQGSCFDKKRGIGVEDAAQKKVQERHFLSFMAPSAFRKLVISEINKKLSTGFHLPYKQ